MESGEMGEHMKKEELAGTELAQIVEGTEEVEVAEG